MGACLSAEDDPKLREFLEVMQPRSKGVLWSNDASVAQQSAVGPAAVAPVKGGKKRALPDADDVVDGGEEADDEYQEMPSAKRKAAAEEGAWLKWHRLTVTPV